MASALTPPPAARNLEGLGHRYFRLFQTAYAFQRAIFRKQTATAYPDASFMGLPLELRQMILEYALPDIIPAAHIPPILLTHWRLCLEAEFTLRRHPRRYVLKVEGDTIAVMGEQFSLTTVFPPDRDCSLANFAGYQHIKEVVLAINCPSKCCDCDSAEKQIWPKGCDKKSCWHVYKDGIRRATYILRELAQLRSLRIHINGPSKWFGNSAFFGSVRSLSRMLNAFNHIRGLAEVKFLVTEDQLDQGESDDNPMGSAVLNNS